MAGGAPTATRSSTRWSRRRSPAARALRSPQARLRAAQAQTVAARAGLAPRTAIDASVTRQRYPQNDLYPPPLGGSWSTEARAALDFSWELDFWGRNRQRLASALSGEEAAEADRQAARLAIAVAVVQAYIQFDLNYALLAVTSDNLKQQQSILDLTQQRVGAGLETVARVKQSEGTVALTRAGLAFVEASVALSRNQLADLAGAGPDRGQALQRPQLQAPADIMLPSVLPADLLGRRPDVVAARAQVQAAAHDIKAAEADFYPNVNLTAFAGFQAFGLSQVFESSDRILGARTGAEPAGVQPRRAARAAVRAPGAVRQLRRAVQPDAARCGEGRRRRRGQLAGPGTRDAASSRSRSRPRRAPMTSPASATAPASTIT